MSSQSLLVFAKSADDSLTALAIEAGDILRVEGARIIGGRVIGEDTTQLRCLLNCMTVSSLKAVFSNLGMAVRARGAITNRRATMRKDDYVDAIVENWQALNERATVVASAVATNNNMSNLLALAGQNDGDDSDAGNAQAAGSGGAQEAPATLRPFVGSSFKLDDSLVMVNVMVKDMRVSPIECWCFKLQVEMTQSVCTLNLQVAERIGGSGYKQVLIFKGIYLPQESTIYSLFRIGFSEIDDMNDIVAELYNEDDEKWVKIVSSPFVLDADSGSQEYLDWIDYVNDPEIAECGADAVFQRRLEKDMPRGYLKDASCFNDEPSNSEIPKIRVSIFKFDGELLFTLDSVDEDCTVYMLKEAILEEIFDRVMKLPADQRKKALKNPLSMDGFVLKHCVIGERMNEDWKLMEYMEEDDDSYHMDVSMDLRLRGGGLVRKHISKQEAVKKLQSKARDYAMADDEGFNFDALPVEIQNLITAHRQKLDAVKLMATQGSDIIQLALMNAPSNTLNEVKQLLEKEFSGRDDTSEHRLAIVIPLLFATLDSLGSASKVLAAVHGEMLAYLMGYYAEKYHVMFGTEARFNNKGFINDIVAEQDRRRILQDAGAPVNVENQGNCTLM